ncbi:MAG: hypothetical protein AAF125_14790, partial [Chloroflexota bacterium]
HSLPHGYAVTFPIDALCLAATFVDGERRCCRFLHFQFDVAPADTTFTLRVTGRIGVKDFLAQELLPHLPVGVDGDGG